MEAFFPFFAHGEVKFDHIRSEAIKRVHVAKDVDKEGWVIQHNQSLV